MPNQREIAKKAGVTQACVSMALRGDPAVAEQTRQHIIKIAEDLGYQPNAYVSTLMAHIRSGRPPCDKGCIALLVDQSEEDASTMFETKTSTIFEATVYQEQYRGIVNRAHKFGFNIEVFYLKSPGMTAARMDQILQARGITGIILFPAQKPSALSVDLAWNHYAMATISYSWPMPAIDRVTTHHRHNVQLAFQKMIDRGYKKIGMCLPPVAVHGVDSSWLAGFLLAQERLPHKQRIPLFVGKPGLTPINDFKKWVQKWNPDALIGLIGHEQEWLREMNLRIPEDIGVACVNRPAGSPFPGVEEHNEAVGAGTVDLVVAQIHRNEYGLPLYPKLIQINGDWVDEKTISIPG